VPTPFTAKQGQYLAFIYYYSKIHGIPPAEADFRRFFRVTPPVVHQMIKTLHTRGFIDENRERHAQSASDSLVQNCRIWTNVGSPVRWRRLAALRTTAMDEFSNIWIAQCDAARGIRDDWGTRKALGYLVGEKLLNYIHAADSDPSWDANVPTFAAEIHRIFTHEELQRVKTRQRPTARRPVADCVVQA
jgi:hypothetical protein